MFTGINDLYQLIAQGGWQQNAKESSYLDSIDSLKQLYPFDEQSIGKLPDGIQQIFFPGNFKPQGRAFMLIQIINQLFCPVMNIYNYFIDPHMLEALNYV